MGGKKQKLQEKSKDKDEDILLLNNLNQQKQGGNENHSIVDWKSSSQE